jgi:transposase
LIVSTRVPNEINTYLTRINKHNGEINNELQLIYVIDKNTKLPIYFRIVAGNIIDNTSLINTINTLNSFNINIKFLLVDAGYSSAQNILQLIETNIPFLTRMSQNRVEYKALIKNYMHILC